MQNFQHADAVSAIARTFDSSNETAGKHAIAKYLLAVNGLMKATGMLGLYEIEVIARYLP